MIFGILNDASLYPSLVITRQAYPTVTVRVQRLGGIIMIQHT